MENYIGKICPFCKTEIKDGEAVKVCPSCSIPHHEGCWEENKGCTTFGCSEQHYEAQGTNPTDFCANCGEVLESEQMFCPKCGTAKATIKKNICGRCGAELQEGQEFCSKCGQKAGLTIDSDVSTAINQFNTNVDRKKKKAKVLPIIIAVVLIACIGIGAVGMHIVKTQKAKAAKEEYLENAKEFLYLSGTAGVNLEDIADTIQTYWYENIWDDKHGSSIETAILYAMVDKSDEIDQAKTYDAEMKSLYSELKSVPDEISKDDREDIKEICDAVKDLYNVYTDFYSLATDPSGNYNSYSSNNNKTTDEFLSSYRALENLLD